MCLLPIGAAVAGPDCKTKCASKKATTVAKSDCAKAKCDKAMTIAKKDCDKSECDKAKCDKAAVVSTDCDYNYKCEKSMTKLFVSHDKNKDGKLCKAEFMTLVKATMGKQSDAKNDKVTAAN
ncbi:MAG: hypothetical protein AB8F34_01760 [Akkermansiaceae bacterium]